MLLLILSPFIGIIPFLISLYIWVKIVIAYKNRKYFRAVIQSYVLENKMYLPRLTDDKDIRLTYVGNGWEIDSKRNGKDINGFIEKRNVSKLKYFICKYFWYAVDDDCTVDTVAIGYGEDILQGEHFPNAPKFFINRVQKEQEFLEKQLLGNTFELGRNRTSVWTPTLSTLWMLRNLFYNFNYLNEEIREHDKNNFYHRFTTKYFDWHFGFIPYTNSKRKGRLVYFSEDIKHLDR